VGIAVVTGAGRGLGRAIAGRLSSDGHEIVAVDIDQASADAAAAGLGGRGRQCDVADLAAVRALAEDVGPVDILINNAGIWRFGPLIEAAASDIEDVLNVNLLGTLHCCQAFVPGMAERGGGAIVNQSSTAAWMAAGYYGIAKLAIHGITGSFARELGPMGIRVNAIAPGPTDTEATRSTVPRELLDQLLATMPLARMGTPEDMADACLFLLSDEARWITGHVLNVDGGQIMRV